MDLNALIEVKLADPDAFLKVKETLTRVGIASKKDKTLYQSCHILHKRGKYYITHFKEMFLLDGKESSLTDDDLKRRNTIANLLEEWGLLQVVAPEKIGERMNLSNIKVLSFKERGDWILCSKYNIGKK